VSRADDLSVAFAPLFDMVDSIGIRVTGIPIWEDESSNYQAARYGLNGFTVLLRVAKITPKKVGLFVTLWKRLNEGSAIEPYSDHDAIDFVVVVVSQEVDQGFFVFDRSWLIANRVLTTKLREGKRAFRIYPPWVATTSKQAQKSQRVQEPHFFDRDANEKENRQRLEGILKGS
jgi:hypothetical protein